MTFPQEDMQDCHILIIVSVNQSEHTSPAVPPAALRFDRYSARCLVALSPAGGAPPDAMVRQLTAADGSRPSVLAAACLPGETGTEHSALGRLLGASGTEPSRADLPHAAREHVDELLRQAPVVLSLSDAQWCDDGTLRWIDHLVREAANRPLTVVMTLPPGALPGAPAALHAMVAGDHCAVVDLPEPRPSGTGGPHAPSPGAPGRRESQLLRVAQAAALLRSTDPDLVGALAGLPAGVVARHLEQLLPPAAGPAAPHRLDSLIATLPAAEADRMRAQAAEVLNDAGRPPGQVADLILGQPALDRPWMAGILKEAARADRRDRPASAARYLQRLHRDDPADAAVRADLAAVLPDIDPAAAREHLEHARAGADDPRIRARTALPLRLTALMTHRVPDTPRHLDALLDDVRGTGGTTPPAARTRPAGPGHASTRDGDADRHPPHPTAPPHPDDATEHLALAARALRDALTGVDRLGADAAARQVLEAARPRGAWARVAAAQVLGLADDTPAALGHLDRIIADSGRREETWADCHARSARALLLFETGRAHEAADAARAASRIARGHGWEEHSHLAPVTLALALAVGADADRAEEVLRRLDGRRLADSVWAYHHHLVAQGLVARLRGRLTQALDLMERCGTSLAEAHIGNPLFTTWWVHSADLLVALGRRKAAAERAELGRHLAQRWPTPRSAGLSLLVQGLTADPPGQIELLTESVHLLDSGSDRLSLTLAELRLGQALLRRGDRRTARDHLYAARSAAVRHGLTVLAEPAAAALARAGGGRPARGELSPAERPVVEMAARGATNRAIADALFLTVRTVEYHLTNAYRKLGVTGRSGLAGWLESQPAPDSPRTPGEPR
jgi:DNA-binding CsgD family transcriptional regulator/tetratricopeptide (TPR) repeat protein